MPFPLEPQGGAGGVWRDALRLRSAAAEELRAYAAITMGPIALPDGAVVHLELERIAIEGLGIDLDIDGAPAGHVLELLDLSSWSGSVRGHPASHAQLSFSRHGSRGWLRFGGRTWHLVAGRGAAGNWQSSVSYWYSEQELELFAGPREPFCQGAPRPPENRERGGANGPGRTIGSQSLTLLNCPIALEADYQLFQVFGDVWAELTYVLSLVAAVSDRYRDDLAVVLTFPHLNLWTTPNDPWTTPDVDGGSAEYLNELVSSWAGAIPASAALGHVISGAPIGGGLAYVGVLCNSNWGFGVSGNLGGDTVFPVAQGPLNWDFIVLSHELGHNFGAKHTHDECPPLDECAPVAYFGDCQLKQTCISSGTIMSYCHLCPGGSANIAPVFHTAQIPGMRASAEESCLVPVCNELGECYVGTSGAGPADGTPTHPFSKVQDGLAAAAACGKGKVIVFSGSYGETLSIDQPVVIESSGGPVTIGD